MLQEPTRPQGCTENHRMSRDQADGHTAVVTGRQVNRRVVVDHRPRRDSSSAARRCRPRGSSSRTRRVSIPVRRCASSGRDRGQSNGTARGRTESCRPSARRECRDCPGTGPSTSASGWCRPVPAPGGRQRGRRPGEEPVLAETRTAVSAATVIAVTHRRILLDRVLRPFPMGET